MSGYLSGVTPIPAPIDRTALVAIFVFGQLFKNKARRRFIVRCCIPTTPPDCHAVTFTCCRCVAWFVCVCLLARLFRRHKTRRPFCVLLRAGQNIWLLLCSGQACDTKRGTSRFLPLCDNGVRHFCLINGHTKWRRPCILQEKTP